jgi:hypothetical protein
MNVASVETVGFPAGYHHLQPQMWGYGPKVRVRQDDLPRAQAWLKAYEQRRKSRQDDLD